ncbi:MAG: hypothetical protein AAF192_22350, partial [Pseudomonadota bacterium]
PDDPSPLYRLARRGAGPKLNQINGSVQLRYEAVDTMESAALKPYSSDATKSNIELAMSESGIGHICSNQLDKYGRPICFVFAGDTAYRDGANDVFLDPDGIADSLNVQQLARGHAYPLFYDTLYDDLRMRCIEVSKAAKAAKLNVWAADATNAGAAWTGDPDTLPPMFPKLWRRIDKYAVDETFFDEDRPIAGLKAWLRHMSDERVSLPAQCVCTGFDDLIETDDDTVRMTADPLEMVVISR